MWHRLAISSVVAMALASCESCPECPQQLMPSGTFHTREVLVSSSALPWRHETKTIDVDVASRTVRMRYVRDGHQVEVTWRMTSLSECP